MNQIDRYLTAQETASRVCPKPFVSGVLRGDVTSTGDVRLDMYTSITIPRDTLEELGTWLLSLVQEQDT